MGKQGTPVAAAVYCRISLDRSGEGLGVARQEELCRKRATELGWLVAEVYVDGSVSAYSGKPRPHFERMLADLEAGHRDGVVVVDTDRLTRRMSELETFVDLADRHGVALATVSGETDLSTTDGRFYARIMGVVARQESEKKAERVARESEQAARRGVPRGSRRPFGWEDDKTTIRPEEAVLIREAAQRVLAGETVPSVARDWNARGIPTAQNAKYGWSAATLAGVLRNPRLAGLRAYKGDIVAEGLWEPILDRGVWEMLAAKIRRVARVGQPSPHLLTSILRCGRCGGPLWTSWRPGTGDTRVARYACIKRPGGPGCGSLTVTARPVEDIIRDAVITAVTGPALADAVAARSGRDTEAAEAARELADAEARREEAADMFASGEIDRREWSTIRERTDKRINDATRSLNRQSGPLIGLPTNETELRQTWDTQTIEWQRALITAVTDTITIKPAQGAYNTFNPERIHITWRA
ncbi:recombinase family protein [bacterium]|nr:recombinase family protein [bacterium]